MSTNKVFHGSDIEIIASQFNIEQSQISNFASNVNPLGISDYLRQILLKNIDVISEYPDKNYKSLKTALSTYCGVMEDYIIVGNGTSELISLLISTRGAKKALLLGPTYSEYEREFSLTGGSITEYRLQASNDFAIDYQDLYKTLAQGYDFFMLCNPNNPTGSSIPLNELEPLLRFCRKHQIFVMIDETYVEFTSDIEFVSASSLISSYDNFILLRGTSKFFASPGLRLGYGLTSNRQFLHDLVTHQTPWSLNSIAELAGKIMFQDKEYIRQTHTLIQEEKQRFYQELKASNNFKLYPSDANFILAKIESPHLTASAVFDACIENHLMIRDCTSFFGNSGEFIRFCILTPKENSKLIQCLLSL